MSKAQYRYTSDELDALMYAEQGYLMFATCDVFALGQIAPSMHGHTTPMRVVADSNYEEWRAHCLRAAILDGCPINRLDRWPYYYRIVAAD